MATELLVGGVRYGGWESIRVTRSIESIAGSFDLSISDRWSGQSTPVPVREEDECRVEIDGVPVIDGYVDRRSPSFDATSRSIAISGRDRAAALVDCSVLLGRWTYRNKTVRDLAATLAAPHEIKVSLGAGVSPSRIKKLVVNPGDSPFDAISRVAQEAELLAVSDGIGGIELVHSGTARVETALVEGENVLSGSGDFDARDRYHRYVVLTQTAGTDENSGDITRVRADATDVGVRRTERELIVHAEWGITTKSARRRADWEARTRAARSGAITIAVQGWRTSGGELWPVNAIVPVRCPTLEVDADRLISEATYSLSSSGETTRLRLVRPDAFTPEPIAVVRKSK